MKKSLKRLKLSKETIAYLTGRELADVAAGTSNPFNSCGCNGETSNGPFNCFTCGLNCQ